MRTLFASVPVLSSVIFVHSDHMLLGVRHDRPLSPVFEIEEIEVIPYFIKILILIVQLQNYLNVLLRAMHAFEIRIP